MLKKILCLILIIKLSEARYGFVPKFYGQDSAIIVDTDKALPQNNHASTNYPTKLRLPPPFPIWRHYPRYHIIPPPPPGQILSINTWPTSKTKPIKISTTTTSSTTTSTTTTTTPKPTTTSPPKIITTNSPFMTDDEFPKELLDIAENKLGLKSLDEIPSISELGQLLGTDTPEETLKYIKQLTANDQGVALMKAYIESTDYTDNSGDLDKDEDDIEEPLKVNDEGLIVITDEDSNDDYEMENEKEVVVESTMKTTSTPRKTPKIINRLKQLPAVKPGFMERIVNYMHLNNIFHKKENNDVTKTSNENKDNLIEENSNYNEINRITEQGEKVSLNSPQSLTEESEEIQTESKITENKNTNDVDDSKTPILIREPIPYNYPVPIRAQTSTTSTSTTTVPPPTMSLPSDTTVVHLNTPKVLIPHVQRLSRVTKIPSKKIEDFLATKPKLLELATKVSRFPIGYDRASPLEAQVMAAVQRAIEQDDDLKKLLSSTATLK